MAEIKADEFKTDRERELEEKVSSRTILVALLIMVALLELLIIVQLRS